MGLLKFNGNTLAIIGNGFDLAHGYNTDYRSFVENTDDDALKRFKEMCDNESLIDRWYDFEKNISIIMTNFYSNAVRGVYGYDNVDNVRQEIQRVFERIGQLLSNYLRTEMSRKKPQYIYKLKQYIDSDTAIINFNYTNLARIYSKHIYYVHGSLEENDILLGYDYRDEPCLAQYSDMYWNKKLRRERLAFNRLLHRMKVSDKKEQRLINSFESYQDMRNSGRGIDENNKKELLDFTFIDRAFKCVLDELPAINYKGIRMVLVIGHSIEADQAYIRSILDESENIDKIVIFRYDAESDDNFSKKVNFLMPFCRNVVTEFYK